MKIYHYTKVEAFKSIIEKRELWAFNYAYMNDSKEYRWSLELLRKFCKEIETNFPNRIIDFVSARQGLQLPFFISFSTMNDDLNQWRAYSNDGNGVCIEFEYTPAPNYDEIPIKQILAEGRNLRSVGSTISQDRWYLIKIHYTNHENNGNEYYGFLQDIYDSLRENNEFGNFDVIDQVAYGIWVASLGIKSEYFEAEDEYRVVRVPIRNYDFEHKKEFLQNELLFKETSKGLQSYIRFPLSDNFKIKSVGLGPKYNGYAWEISDFLQKNGFDYVDIYVSDVPYQ